MKSADKNGFTLIEVIVALVVASLLLTILLRADLVAYERGAVNEHRERAVLLARRIVAGIKAAPFEDGEREGDEAGLHWSTSERAVLVDPRGRSVLSNISITILDKRGRQAFSGETRVLKTVEQG